MAWKRLLTILLVLTAVVPALGADSPAKSGNDEVLKALDAAKASYLKHDFKEVNTQLQLAIQTLQTSRTKKLESFFPAAPEGYTLEPPVEQPPLPPFLQGLGITLDRAYRGKDGKEVRLTFVLDSPLIAEFSQFMASPELVAAGGNMSTYQFAGVSGTKRTEGSTVDLSLIVNATVMIQAKGERAGLAEVEALLKLVDLKGMKEAFQP